MSDVSGEPAMRIEGLGRRFGEHAALQDCHGQLPRGRISALVGRNGAGKTTLLRIATGLLRPSEGTLSVFGRRPGRDGAPRGLAYLAQDRPLYRQLRVEEMLRAGAALNSGGRWDARRVRELVEEAGIAQRSRVDGLSSGQRARLALALALGRVPDLLLLDEPLAGLDPPARRHTLGAVLGEAAERGTTVLMSSHVLAELDEVCDHLILLDGATVRLCGDTEALVSAHRVVTGPAADPAPPGTVHQRQAGRQRTALVHGPGTGPAPTLAELVLGYLEPSQTSEVPA